MSASHQDNGKLLPIHFRKQSFFDVQPPSSSDLNPLGFYLWRHLKTPAHSAPTKNEQTFHRRIFDAYNCPETFGKAEQSVIRRVLAGALSDGRHFGHLL